MVETLRSPGPVTIAIQATGKEINAAHEDIEKYEQAAQRQREHELAALVAEQERLELTERARMELERAMESKEHLEQLLAMERDYLEQARSQYRSQPPPPRLKPLPKKAGVYHRINDMIEEEGEWESLSKERDSFDTSRYISHDEENVMQRTDFNQAITITYEDANTNNNSNGSDDLNTNNSNGWDDLNTNNNKGWDDLNTNTING